MRVWSPQVLQEAVGVWELAGRGGQAPSVTFRASVLGRRASRGGGGGGGAPPGKQAFHLHFFVALFAFCTSPPVGSKVEVHENILQQSSFPGDRVSLFPQDSPPGPNLDVREAQAALSLQDKGTFHSEASPLFSEPLLLLSINRLYLLGHASPTPISLFWLTVWIRVKRLILNAGVYSHQLSDGQWVWPHLCRSKLCIWKLNIFVPKGFFLEAMSTDSHGEEYFSLIFLCHLRILLDLSTDGTLGRGAPGIVHPVFRWAFEIVLKGYLALCIKLFLLATPN